MTVMTLHYIAPGEEFSYAIVIGLDKQNLGA